MIPIHDENPTLRTPVITIAFLLAIVGVWILIQGAGLDGVALAASICNWGFVAAELTGGAPVGTAVPMGRDMACVVDAEAIGSRQ